MRVLARPGFEAEELNPYTYLLCKHIPSDGLRIDEFRSWRALLWHYDIFHIHWPEYYVSRPNAFKAIVGSFGLLFLISWCRLRGTRIVWTVHNLESHRQTRPEAEKWFWSAFTRLLDGYIALTQHGREVARQRFPSLKSVPGFVIPHGHYRDAYPNSVSRLEARRHLQIASTAKVILFFGSVSPYKNVPALVRAFRGLEAPNAVLCIAGACALGRDEEGLRRSAGEDPRIRLMLGFVPKSEVPYLFAASDLVVLPFTEILNSGSALLALSFDRPVLVPAKGAMPELQQCVGEDWVQMYMGDLSTAELTRALRWAADSPRAQAAPLGDLEWRKLGERTLEAYQLLLRAPGHEGKVS